MISRVKLSSHWMHYMDCEIPGCQERFTAKSRAELEDEEVTYRAAERGWRVVTSGSRVLDLCPLCTIRYLERKTSRLERELGQPFEDSSTDPLEYLQETVETRPGVSRIYDFEEE